MNPVHWERIVPSPLGMGLTEQEASAAQRWICLRYEQLHAPKGVRRRTDPPHPSAVEPVDTRLTLREWRAKLNLTITDLLRLVEQCRVETRTDRRGGRYTIETIRQIENGTSDYRHYKAIECIEKALGLEPGELRVERRYERKRAA